MITAALNGSLANEEFMEHPVFGLLMPKDCVGVPAEILDPKNTWQDKSAYDAKANQLAMAFLDNFKQFESFTSEEIRNALPKVVENVH